MSGDKLRGSLVALVTPFTKDGKEIEEGQLRELVEWHIEEGTDGLVPCGTTGESPTLSHSEHERVVEIVVDAVDGRVPVVAGAGSNSTAEAIRFTQHAAKVGADYALVITPYYNKPTQNGLVKHFQAVADASDIPVILYNVPGRTAVGMLPETVAKCAEHPRIAGIKEATGSMQFVAEVSRLCPKDFTILSGDDFTVVPLLSVGGRGVISVTANVWPKLNAEMIRAWESGDTERAKEIQLEILPLASALFAETSPIPCKAAVALMGRCHNSVRLPLTPAEEPTLEQLRKILSI